MKLNAASLSRRKQRPIPKAAVSPAIYHTLATGSRVDKPAIIQRKSSYFRDWERYITSNDGQEQAIPVTPVKSVLQQQDLTHNPVKLPVIAEVNAQSLSEKAKANYLLIFTTLSSVIETGTPENPPPPPLRQTQAANRPIRTAVGDDRSLRLSPERKAAAPYTLQASPSLGLMPLLGNRGRGVKVSL